MNKSCNNDITLACATNKLYQHTNHQLFMFDRIKNISYSGGKYGKGQIIAEFDINPHLWFFSAHFINDPVMPGSLGLEGLWQLLSLYMMWQGSPGTYSALSVDSVKFIQPVLPSAKKITYILDVIKTSNHEPSLGYADGVVLVDNNKVYSATNLAVCLRKNE